MTFKHDCAPESENFQLLPDGTYEFQITDTEERKTKAGDPMVNVECEVINNAEHNGRRVFTNVSFLPKDKPGSGMATHFLKCINMPWEGSIEVNHENWIGEKFKAMVSSRSYKNASGEEKTVNDLKKIEAVLPF